MTTDEIGRETLDRLAVWGRWCVGEHSLPLALVVAGMDDRNGELKVVALDEPALVVRALRAAADALERAAGRGVVSDPDLPDLAGLEGD